MAGNFFNKMMQSSVVGNNIMEKMLVIAEQNAETLKTVQTDVSNMASSMSVIEDLLTVQNKILLEIKDAVGGSGSKDASQKKNEGVLNGFSLDKIPLLGGGGGATGAMGAIVGMAAAVALAATLIGFIPVSTPTEMLMKFGAALATVGVLSLMAIPFVQLLKAFGGMKNSFSFSSEQAGVEASGEQMDIMGMVMSFGGAFVSLIAMSVAVVAASHIMRLMYGGPDLMIKLGLAVMVSIALVPAALAFTFVLNALSKMKMGMNISLPSGVGGGGEQFDIMGAVMSIGGAFVSLMLMSISIVAASHILRLMPSDPSIIDKAIIAGVVGLAMVPIALAFGFLIKAMASVGMNPMTAIIAIAGAAVALPLMMGAFGLGMRALNETMPDTYPTLPDWEWLAKFGLMALVAGGVFYIVGSVVKGMGLPGVILAGLAMPVAFAGLALGIRAWSMFAPSDADYANPMDPLWALQMGLSLLAFSLPMFVLGKLGPLGVISGAAGIVLLMGAIGAGLSAFNFLAPDDPIEVARIISNSLIQPFYAIVDFISYFASKIPLEQAGDIALALLKVGGGYAAFVLAVQGSQGVGNVIGGALNFVGNMFDGFSKLLGGEEQQKATDILIILANNAAKLKGLGAPLAKIGAAFGAIAMVNQTALQKAKQFLIKLDDHSYDKQADQLERIAASFQGISDATNSMNVEAIRATDDLFKTINESIASGSQDTIESLKEMLVDVLEGMSEASRAMTGSGNAFTQGVANIIDKVKGNKEGGEAASTGEGNIGSPQELAAAIKSLESSLKGTLDVYVVNNGPI